MLRLVATFAVPAEFAPWRRMRSFRRLSGFQLPVYVSMGPKTEVHAVITGIGSRLGQAELRDLFRKSADVCIATGLAGSLRKTHSAGSVLVAKSIKSGIGRREVPADDFLVRSAQECGATAVDSFFTSNTVASSAAEKLQLSQIADAVEMESFHILNLAGECNIPAVAIRAISDEADTQVPIDFNRVIDERGQIGWLPALYEIAKTPQRMPQFIRFGFESSRAARRLGTFLEQYTESLADQTRRPFSQVMTAENK